MGRREYNYCSNEYWSGLIRTKNHLAHTHKDIKPCLKVLDDVKIILPLSWFVCPLFHFRMSQNIVLFLKIKVINLLMFLLYPTLFSKQFEKKTNKYLKN